MPATPAQVDLTERQAQVLACLARGMTINQVGDRLGISRRTAKSHCEVLRRKLGITRTGEIVPAWSMMTGDDPWSIPLPAVPS